MKIIENESLNVIISQINAELIDVDDYSKLRIISKNKPNIIITLMEVNLVEGLSEYVKNLDFNVDKNNLDIETNAFDYIVLSIVQENNKFVLKTIPLFELIIASNNLLTKSDGIHLMDNSDKESFNLETKEWTLISV